MNATTKYGFAVLVVALLLFNPLGACAAMSKRAVSHPCCPAPSQNGCAKSSCVCGSTAAKAIAVPSTGGDDQAIAAPVSEDLHQTAVPIRHFTDFGSLLFASNHRFVTLHQFLV
jgi:hypothetical protein